MANVRTATVKWMSGEKYQAETGSGHQFITSGSKADGPGPMELVLVGLAGCTAIDVNDILKKKRLKITGLDVRVEGTRAETYPMVYTDIQVIYTVRGKDIPARAVEQAIHLSEDKYCSVGIMLGKTAKITHRYEIIPE
jgi:putative redox protein